MFFKKKEKEKIRFTNLIDGVVANYPLIRASKLNRPWLKAVSYTHLRAHETDS